MNGDQAIVLAILAATIALFVWGRWRHDFVALAALLACVFAGLVPAMDAFAGFGHPAVITVACVLVLSRALQNTGAVDALAQRLLPATTGPALTIAAITGLAAALSAFMNNVGALALLMPLAIQIASRLQLPPGQVLMPLAFGSILGGMTTLIGTPPNLIVAGFRAQTGSPSFAMFDFTPVGVVLALTGLAFLTLVGWRFVPVRERTDAESFEIGAYLTEARVPDGAKAAGMTLREVENALAEADAQVVGLIRDEVRLPAPGAGMKVRGNDILVIEADPEALASAISALGLQLEEAASAESEEEDEDKRKEDEKKKDKTKEKGKADASGKNEDVAAKKAERKGKSAKAKKQQESSAAKKQEDPAPKRDESDAKSKEKAKARFKAGKDKDDEEETNSKRAVASDEIVLMELAVLPDSILIGRSATDVRLRTRYGINMLALSRQGRRSMARLRSMQLRAGDVLLMQGAPETLTEFANLTGCVPLAQRSLRIPNRRDAWFALAIMTVAVVGAAFGLVPAAIAFAGAVVAAVVLRVIAPRSVYDAVDWPVIVLLAALIPVAGAMASTGAADLIARFLLEFVAQGHVVIGLAIVLLVSMTLSDVMNNAATAAVMCPIAIGAAGQLGVSADPFLMAVAVGASCAFLTPIGHQNNLLILGPGGFQFGDYWRLGLPLEVIIVAVGVPMILFVWPL